LELFNGKGMCSACHVSEPGASGEPPVFTDFTYDNLGLPRNPENPFYTSPFNPEGAAWIDPGLGGFLASVGYYPVELSQPEMGKQKVPTLRNVDLRPYPGFVKAYGHNGFFKSLEGIVHFYNTRDVKDACPAGYTEAQALDADCWPSPEVAENVNTSELGNIGLTPDEEAAIVAFMKTLSDGFILPGCTLTAGYWKTHAAEGPAQNYDPTWDLKAGGDAKFFSDAWDTGYTWREIMMVSPKRGNAYITLAQQYIAAWLNINNVDPDRKADPAALGTAMADAEHLLSTYMPTYDWRKDPDGVRAQFLVLAERLDDFNNGYIGPGHCSCPCWSGQNLALLTASSCVQSTDNDYLSVDTLEQYVLTTSARPGGGPECNVLDFGGEFPIGFALAITYPQFLECRSGLEMLIDQSGLMCSEP
jgi:hypothetical protein